jgi:hypothetical protein
MNNIWHSWNHTVVKLRGIINSSLFFTIIANLGSNISAETIVPINNIKLENWSDRNTKLRSLSLSSIQLII